MVGVCSLQRRESLLFKNGFFPLLHIFNYICHPSMDIKTHNPTARTHSHNITHRWSMPTVTYIVERAFYQVWIMHHEVRGIKFSCGLCQSVPTKPYHSMFFHDWTHICHWQSISYTFAKIKPLLVQLLALT